MMPLGMTTIFPLWAFFCLVSPVSKSPWDSFISSLAYSQPACFGMCLTPEQVNTWHIKCTWGKSQQGFEQCLEQVLHCYAAAVFTKVHLKLWTVRLSGVLHFTPSCESGSSVCYLQHCLKPQVSVTVWGRQECTSGTNMLCRRGK